MDIITQKEIASIICYFLPSHMQIKDELQYKLKLIVYIMKPLK